MLIVRATKKLRDRIGSPDLRAGERSTTLLGEWYATRFVWRPDLLLVNESTLMPVLLPLTPAATALTRAVDRIAAAMRTYGAAEVMIAAEVEQMATHRIGPTATRSVVGIMTEFTFLADHWRGPDLDELSARLAATPYSRAQPTAREPPRWAEGQVLPGALAGDTLLQRCSVSPWQPRSPLGIRGHPRPPDRPRPLAVLHDRSIGRPETGP